MAGIAEALRNLGKILIKFATVIADTVKKIVGEYNRRKYNDKLDKRMEHLRMALRITKKTTQRRRLERNIREVEGLYRR